VGTGKKATLIRLGQGRIARFSAPSCVRLGHKVGKHSKNRTRSACLFAEAGQEHKSNQKRAQHASLTHSPTRSPQVRHGVMVVGETGSGKSECIRVLREACTTLADPERSDASFGASTAACDEDPLYLPLRQALAEAAGTTGGAGASAAGAGGAGAASGAGAGGVPFLGGKRLKVLVRTAQFVFGARRRSLPGARNAASAGTMAATVTATTATTVVGGAGVGGGTGSPAVGVASRDKQVSFSVLLPSKSPDLSSADAALPSGPTTASSKHLTIDPKAPSIAGGPRVLPSPSAQATAARGLLAFGVVELHSINPKALTIGQLYGETRRGGTGGSAGGAGGAAAEEWRDGILSHIVRNCAGLSQSDMAQLQRGEALLTPPPSTSPVPLPVYGAPPTALTPALPPTPSSAAGMPSMGYLFMHSSSRGELPPLSEDAVAASAYSSGPGTTMPVRRALMRRGPGSRSTLEPLRESSNGSSGGSGSADSGGAAAGAGAASSGDTVMGAPRTRMIRRSSSLRGLTDIVVGANPAVGAGAASPLTPGTATSGSSGTPTASPAALVAAANSALAMGPGAASAAAEKAAASPAVPGSTGGSVTHWVVFDGVIDSRWVENLNTVLDDSRVLCLPNGERINMPPNVRSAGGQASGRVTLAHS